MATRILHAQTTTADDRTDRELFEEYGRTEDRRIRNEIAERHLHLADFYVKKYRNRGVPDDDLRQVALLAMIRGIDRFDPARGFEFSTFASRTMEGELKRYFRDRTWSVRPPRRIQELHLDVRTAQQELEQQLGRIPTPKDIATRLEVTVDEVIEAMEASAAHTQVSLDKPMNDDDQASASTELALACSEAGFESVDSEIVVRNLLARLPARERAVIQMRFFDNMTQPEIAERMGVSQSYLSRIIRKTLAGLRDEVEVVAAAV